MRSSQGIFSTLSAPRTFWQPPHTANQVYTLLVTTTHIFKVASLIITTMGLTCDHCLKTIRFECPRLSNTIELVDGVVCEHCPSVLCYNDVDSDTNYCMLNCSRCSEQVCAMCWRRDGKLVQFKRMQESGQVYCTACENEDPVDPRGAENCFIANYGFALGPTPPEADTTP